MDADPDHEEVAEDVNATRRALDELEDDVEDMEERLAETDSDAEDVDVPDPTTRRSGISVSDLNADEGEASDEPDE